VPAAAGRSLFRAINHGTYNDFPMTVTTHCFLPQWADGFVSTNVQQ
jgi:hypothetical protein